METEDELDVTLDVTDVRRKYGDIYPPIAKPANADEVAIKAYQDYVVAKWPEPEDDDDDTRRQNPRAQIGTLFKDGVIDPETGHNRRPNKRDILEVIYKTTEEVWGTLSNVTVQNNEGESTCSQCRTRLE